MAVGTVKWFSSEKGYGFITPEEGTKDLFVHYSAIQGDGYKSLNEGDKVEYEETAGRKGPHAREALESIIGVYWKPAYKHVRMQWNRSNEEAKDLVQGFFAALIQQDILAKFDPAILSQFILDFFGDIESCRLV